MCSYYLRAQEPDLREIINESHSDLVFVGKATSVSMGFNNDGVGDFTVVAFSIRRILAGSEKYKTITFKLSGHFGFRKGQSIVFATRAHFSRASNLLCTMDNCYFYLPDWDVAWTKSREKTVRKLLKKRHL